MKKIFIRHFFILSIFLSLKSWGQEFEISPYLQLLQGNQGLVIFKLNQVSSLELFTKPQNGQIWRSHGLQEAKQWHRILMDSLVSGSRYQYKIKFSTGKVWEVPTAHFRTQVAVAKRQSFRFWAIGDPFPGATQGMVAQAMGPYFKEKAPDFIITQGDNVYCGGQEGCYQQDFFGVYKDILQQAPIYPVTGNHDYRNNPRQPPELMAYFDLFHLPSEGQLGGVPSKSEQYYSFNYGNAHFIALESYAPDVQGRRLFDKDSPQYQWLENDLKANTLDWTIIYFHYPIFTKGSYDSDVVPDLQALRKSLAPLFEKYGVDLVLNGHSHIYERSRPTKGHYSNSNEFNASIHQKQSSSGKFDGSANACPYVMDKDSNDGPVYIVNGLGGKPTGAWIGRHPVMEFSSRRPGSLLFDVDGSVLSGKYIDSSGIVLDQFMLVKTVSRRCQSCFNNLNPKGCGPSKEPMFSSKQALSNAQNLAFCQQVGEVKLLASGDSSAKFRWYEAGKLLGEQMEWKLDANQVGKRVLELSQVVAGLESAKTNIALEVYPQPAAPRGIIGPDSVYVGRTYRFQVQNPENVTYQWTWPSAWSAKVDGNALELVPSLLDGMIQVRQISSQTCPSPSTDKLLKALLVLEAPTSQSEFKAYPNPSTGAWIQVSIPSSHQGGQLELWDLQGKRRWQSQHAQGQQGYALGALANGTYLLRLQKAGQPSLEQKLWIQN